MSLRAISRAPSDPLLHLLAGAASLGRMTNRQAANRHHMAIQGVALINQSAQLQGKEESAINYYNLGRAFQSLCGCSESEIAFILDANGSASLSFRAGLDHLAIPQYEKCLALCRQTQSEKQDVSCCHLRTPGRWHTLTLRSTPNDFSSELDFCHCERSSFQSFSRARSGRRTSSCALPP